MTGAPLTLVAPLDGWCLALADVPDAVFADGMAGDGVAIDPTSAVVRAPCDGEIVPMRDAKHALTVRSAIGVDVLIHVGIDTVGLHGKGFDLLVAAGDRVHAGQELLRFDLDRVARAAPSLVSPIVLPAGGTIVRRFTDRAVKSGEPLMEILAGAPRAGAATAGELVGRELTIVFDHGLHVRPAAQIVAALKPFTAEVTLAFGGRSANARSTVAMMSLGAHRGDTVEALARGADASLAMSALEALMPAAQGPGRGSTVALRPADAVARPGESDPGRIAAAIASRGLAVGRVVHWEQAELPANEAGEGEAAEEAALDRALAVVQRHLESLMAGASGERRALLVAHAELAVDPELRVQAGAMLGRGKSAAFAWRHATRAVAETLARLDDTRMRERAADLRDLEVQVVRVLAGQDPAATRRHDAGSVIVADDLPPSAVMALDPGNVAGLCMARGGSTSHVAILAAASGIPALVGAGPRVLALPEGTRVILDAEHGWLDVDPDAAELARLERVVAQRREERAADLADAAAQACTRDGLRIRVCANLGSLDEVAPALACGAEGCGLLRTEFLYLDRREAPGEDEQANEYQRIADALGGRPLAIRTLDVGGDKPLAYLPLPAEENPALGLRGLRTSLRDLKLLREQVRAILRVSPPGQCRILLPMVTDVEELRTVRALVDECARELGATQALALGAMIETPAAALLAETLVDVADFLSIGSNDLAQYTLAIDRGHPELAPRLDALHPAVLRLIAFVADAALARGRPVSLCGALGSDVDALAVLIGLGVHEVSAAPATIPRLKRTVRSLEASQCRELARRALQLSTPAEVRDLVAAERARVAPIGGPP